MSPPAKKHKTSPSVESAPSNHQEPPPTTTTAKMSSPSSPPPATDANPPSPPPPPQSSSSTTTNPQEDRLARFRALQARAKTSSQQNMRAATLETQRAAADPTALTALTRKHAIASHKLLKAEIEEAGGDFERKRAWDWTVEESERWDKRTKKKEAHRDDTSFRDYGHEAEKAYKRQLRSMGAPDLEKYTREKLAAVERAAAAGTLEIVETEDGEMIAVDKDGTFFSTADSTGFASHRPDKAAVDRLVADMRKQEEKSLAKRRERMAKNAEDGGGDVTYINEKNKQFNQKLARFYNKYTAEIRDSFERGTMV